MNQWPDYPIVPLEWDDQQRFHPYVTATLAEGFCPKHRLPLRRADGKCLDCGLFWELTSTAGTISTDIAITDIAITDRGYPHFAQTDGITVLVASEL